MEKETFDLLFACFKILEDTMIRLPTFGSQLIYTAIKYDDEREQFDLIINRKGFLNTNYLTYLLKSRYGILIRLDIDGPPHDDREGNSVDTPHLHIFNEENGNGKHAVSLSSVTDIELLNDITDSLIYFMEYNNIRLVEIEEHLF